MVKRGPPCLASGVTIWTGVRVQWLLGQWREESTGQIPIQDGMPLGECSTG